MNEHRRQILQMLSESKISADEAERLIAALEEPVAGSSSQNASDSGTKARPKYLRVQVDSEDDGMKARPKSTFECHAIAARRSETSWSDSSASAPSGERCDPRKRHFV